jgi:predicted RNA polymerase sigma factor
MEPVGRPLEPVDATARMRVAAVEAFVTTVWTDHHAELYAFLVRTTRDPGVAEDLLQEAFLRLRDASRPGANPRAWPYRVGANSRQAGPTHLLRPARSHALRATSGFA